MRISELTARTGVPKETIHYYVREGVLRRPRKTGRNTADYSERYVEQIRVIKRLQDNYFLPLSVIKKLIKQQKGQSRSDRSSFQFLSEHFRPLDRLFISEITGRESFREATGLGQKWLARMEAWGIISFETRSGRRVYSQDDVIIAKLLVDMDNIGFGPKEGYDPEDLRPIADFIRQYVKNSQKEFYQSSLERLTSDELIEKGSKFTEIMSLFFYHLYRKVVREEYMRLLEAAEAMDRAKAGQSSTQ
ncbi:MAG: MerR family transcriptional regulator [Deltaproteobacteria bacterium]|nr:MerR family transcriptional regulator [Deltaproteobacteria bacterium]